MPLLPRAARAALHFWEEPCISGTKGSGTVFFSGCSLSCVFCQNYEISHDGFGKTVSINRLSEIFRELEAEGAHNINLVNPTHYVYAIKQALIYTDLKYLLSIIRAVTTAPKRLKSFTDILIFF